MRRVFVSNIITLDGYFAGPNGEIDWFVNIPGKEFDEYGLELIRSVGTMVFGRFTYELMSSYWPTATAETDDQRIIDAMNGYPKVVFSRTLDRPDWNNTRLVSGDPSEEISKLKEESGKDMVIYGSGTIVAALAQKGLIDEYRIVIAPIVLGKGKSMFDGIRGRIPLRLVDSRTLGAGLAVLRYVPDRERK